LSVWHRKRYEGRRRISLWGIWRIVTIHRWIEIIILREIQKYNISSIVRWLEQSMGRIVRRNSHRWIWVIWMHPICSVAITSKKFVIIVIIILEIITITIIILWILIWHRTITTLVQLNQLCYNNNNRSSRLKVFMVCSNGQG